MDDDRKADTGQIQPKQRLRSLDDIDNRTTAARRARDLVRGIEIDLGGTEALSTGQRELTQHAAVLGALIADVEARWLSGEQVDVSGWLSAVNNQRRLLEVLGLERKARDVTLSDYLARKERS